MYNNCLIVEKKYPKSVCFLLDTKNLSPQQLQSLKMYNLSATTTPMALQVPTLGANFTKLSIPAFSLNTYGNLGGGLANLQAGKTLTGQTIKLNPANGAGGAAKGAKGLSSDAKGAIGMGASVVGSTVGGLLSGGMSSGAGNTISSLGSGIGGAVSMVNPLVGGIISGASGLIGGAVNGLFGSKLDNEKIASIEGETKALRNTKVDDSSTGSILAQMTNQDWGSDFSKSDVGSEGMFSNKASKEYNRLKGERLMAQRNVSNIYNQAIYNQANNATFDIMRNIGTEDNIAAFGGFINPFESYSPAGAIDYERDTYRYLKDKEKNNNTMTNLFASTPSIFDIGGTLQTNGANYGNMMHIDAGQSHEQNPYDGVQIGVDNEGTPNLVEENEVIYNDYVYSNRLTVPDFKKQYKNKKKAPYEAQVLWNYSGRTFADAAKKIEKSTGSDERTEDPIANRGMESMLEVLAGVQEKEREKEKLKEQQEAIDNMTPEEFAAMQQQQQMMAQQQQMAQQQAMQAEQQGMQQQPTQEELAMMQQQQEAQQMQNPQDDMAVTSQPMAAYGGKLFYNGGYTKKVDIPDNATDTQIIKALRKAGYSKDYSDWLKDNEGKSRRDFITYINTQVDRNNTINYLKSLSPAVRKYLASKAGVTLENTNDENTDKVIDAIADKLKTPNAVKQSYDEGYNLPLLNRTAGTLPEYAQVSEGESGISLDEEALKNLQYVQDELGKAADKSTYRASKNNPMFREKTAAQIQDEENYGWFTDYVSSLSDDNPQLKQILKWYDGARPEGFTNKFYTTNEEGDEVLRENWRDLWVTGRNDGVEGALHVNLPMKTASNKSRTRYMLGDQEIDATNYLDENNKWKPNIFFNIDDGTTTQEEDGTNLTTYNLTRSDMPSIDNYKVLGTPPKGVSDNNNDLPKAPTWPYILGAGIQGAGLLYNALKPIDYSNADALEKAAVDAGKYTTVGFTPVSQKLKYEPMDIWSELNRLDANARATDRAIRNTGTNRGAVMAGIISNAYNNQLAHANAYRQALEYNNALQKQVGEFNRQTDQINSEGLLKADTANQDASTKARGYTLEGMKNAYAMRQSLQDAKSNAISAGITGLANLAWNYADTKAKNDLLKYGYDKVYSAAKGGKLRKRRKGLTF